ncbi:NfeD family protein [Bacillus sp. 123MFChir2]|uniref:NfeD family protein n=1 Tax=Bacillus sp. 123MFChir2 TaxID=1169144 RepID=UPI000360BBCB|nr:NfeD family protein [Bacillus sp. 123MFChir2]
MTGWVIWFVIAGLLFIAEMLTVTFYLLWLGIGAVVGGLIGLFVPNSLLLQVVIASVVSLSLTFFTKRISKNFREAKGYTDAVDQLVGKKGIIVQAVTNEAHGIVKIEGDMWTAVSDEPILDGESVIIVKRSSTVVHVKRECEL